MRAVILSLLLASEVASAQPAAPAAWIIEPTAEAPNAAKQGAADVERAQQLAKNKQLLQAVDVLERVARAYPAALHDCNLSLAYLRAGALTRAQLMWDVAGLRNSQRPTWCTGNLSTQLSTALHAAGYVPVNIDVVPADAVISAGGVDVRGIHTLWLPPGPVFMSARAPGHVDASQQVTITAPSTRIGIQLKTPDETKPVEPPPAGHEPATGSATAPPLGSDGMPLDLDAHAPPAHPSARPPPIAPPPAASPSKVPVIVGLAATGVGLVTGVVFDVAASGARSDANKLYPFQAGFSADQSRFSRDRALAYTGDGVAIAGAVFTAVWWLTHREHAEHAAPPVGLAAVHGGGALTLEWTIP
jgi:hypothetical protein